MIIAQEQFEIQFISQFSKAAFSCSTHKGTHCGMNSEGFSLSDIIVKEKMYRRMGGMFTAEFLKSAIVVVFMNAHFAVRYFVALHSPPVFPWSFFSLRWFVPDLLPLIKRTLEIISSGLGCHLVMATERPSALHGCSFSYLRQWWWCINLLYWRSKEESGYVLKCSGLNHMSRGCYSSWLLCYLCE